MSSSISPTAHYTGYVWVRNGLAPQALATPEGRLFYHAVEPAMTVSRLLGQPTFRAWNAAEAAKPRGAQYRLFFDTLTQLDPA